MIDPSGKKVVIITGASSGIGAAVALRLAKEGLNLTLAARRLSRLEQVAAEVASLGGEALTIQTDVSNHDQLNHMIQETLKRWGRIDVLFNNAGLGQGRILMRTRPERIREIITTNLTAVIECANLVLPVMLRQKSGQIINVASIAGLVSTPGGTVYGATKFGVIGFSDALRRELRGSGISVSAFCPGFTPSEISSNLKSIAEGKSNAPRPPGLMPISYVADQVARLIHRPRARVIIPRSWKFLVLVATLFPGLTDFLMPAFISMKSKGR